MVKCACSRGLEENAIRNLGNESCQEILQESNGQDLDSYVQKITNSIVISDGVRVNGDIYPDIKTKEDGLILSSVRIEHRARLFRSPVGFSKTFLDGKYQEG